MISSLLLLTLISLSTDLRWVEVDVSLWEDGRADFVYKVRWKVISGSMSGFYLQGLSVEPYFDYDNSHAVDASGRKYPIEVKDLGNKYDVVLARGRRYGPGEITYIIHFGGDLGKSKNLAKTQSEFGDLVVLHWAPPQWDEALEHYTIYVHYPMIVRGSEVNPDDYGFRTEEFMNENYLLSYYGQYYQGSHYFTVRIHLNNVQRYEKMKIQQYVPASYFHTERFGTIKVMPEEKKRFAIPYELIYVLLSVVPYIFYNNKKAKQMKGAYSEVASLTWLRDDWVPPKIEVATFRKSGKVAKLDLIEAALFLDYPVNKVLTILASKLKELGIIEIISQNPLKITVLQRPSTMRYYESIFLDAVKPDGLLDEAALKSLITNVVEKISAQAWDCDLKATKAYYAEKIGEHSPDRPLDKEYDRQEYYDYLMRRDFSRHRYYQNMEEGFTIYGEPIQNYSTFLRSDACHSACYVHTACHDACHQPATRRVIQPAIRHVIRHATLPV